MKVWLACYRLRRSEICALKPEDIMENIVYINKVKVLNEKRKWVEKSTKTTSSTREVVIPAKISRKPWISLRNPEFAALLLSCRRWDSNPLFSFCNAFTVPFPTLQTSASFDQPLCCFPCYSHPCPFSAVSAAIRYSLEAQGV